MFRLGWEEGASFKRNNGRDPQEMMGAPGEEGRDGVQSAAPGRLTCLSG